jgi:hypothetical protein
MAAKPLPDIDTLHQLLRYEPETGKLYWKPRYSSDDANQKKLNRWNGANAGKEALCTRDRTGHLCGTFQRRTFYAHRIVWKMHYSEDPKYGIDHIDGNPANNKIENLRSVPHRENMKNTSIPKSNKSGVSGISWFARYGKWSARIFPNGKGVFLGYFEDLEDAAAAVREARKKHNFHSNHGRPSVTPNKDAM